VLRAAVSPHTLANTPTLATVAVSFLEALIPASAGADLLRRGVGLNFSGAASISVPALTLPTGADFVSEGSPIPVVAGSTTPGPTLTPHKLAVITTLTHEMFVNPNAETMVRTALIQSCGPALDKQLFSATAGDATRPAGLLYNIAGLSPASGASGKSEVIVDDLQTLGAAVAGVAANGEICLIASPDAAVALRLRLPQSVEWPVLTSASLPARTVIAVAANAIVSAVEGSPQIDASGQVELHRNTVPLEIVDVGGTKAVPVGSLFQTDQVALRLRWDISWALRTSSGLAYMSGVNW
jgi:hypothetical protein